MTHHRALRRLTAVLASALLLLAQLALPMSALATGVDQTPPTTLPTVAVVWTDLNGNVNPYPAAYSTDGFTRRLWIQLSTDAFSGGTLALSITPPVAPEGVSYTCDSSAGVDLTGIAASADYTTPVTQVMVYQDGQPVDVYNVYVSAAPMPAESQPASVPVYYLDADTNAELASETLTLDPGPHTVYPTLSVPEGYTPTPGTATEYTVNVSETGAADQSPLYFYYSKPSAPPEAAKGSLTVHYVDAGGVDLLNPLWMEPTDGQVVSAAEIAGYALNANSQSSYTIHVSSDGTTDPADIYFNYDESGVTPPDTGDTGDTGSGEAGGTGETGETGETGGSGEPAAPTLTPVGRYCVTTSTVNLRSSPNKPGKGEKDNIVTQVNSNTYLWLYGTLSPDGAWSSVNYEGTDCYIMSEFTRVLSQEDSDTYNYAPGHVPFPGTETEPPPVTTGTLIVHYVVTDNSATIPDASVVVNDGPNTVGPTIAIPDGYQIAENTPATFDVTVAGGVCTPAEVTFTFEPVYVPPVTGTLVVHYAVTDNSLTIPDASVVVNDGPNTVGPTIAIPDGYQIAENTPATFDVTVAGGVCAPAEVTFTFEPVYVPPVTGTLVVHYAVTDNSLTIPDASVVVNDGPNTVGPTIAIPDGYQIAENTPATFDVTVAGGVCSPAEVTFTFEPVYVPPVAGTLVVHYAVTDNAITLPDGSATLSDGPNTVGPTIAIPDGYQIAAGTPATFDVTVAGGVCTPAEVTFTFEPIVVVPAKGTLTVHYATTDNSLSLPDATVEVTEGTGTVGPTIATPQGYQIAANTPATYEVTVDHSGVCTPAAITFTYAPVSGRVTILYVDQQNAPVAAEQTKAMPVGTTVVYPEASIPTGYQLALDCPGSYSVTVDANGLTNPATITFYYSKNTPQYLGYGLINTRTALRSDASTDDSTLKGMLEKDTLVIVNGQPVVNGVTWAGVQTLDSQIGLVLDSSVTRLTDAQAQPYIDAYKAAHATATPTATPAPTAVPAQLSGYYVAVGTGVPLRMVNSQFSEVRSYLPYNTVVYVSGQLYNEGYGWHITAYGSLAGYVRADQLRKLSDAEVEAYKNSLGTPTPTPVSTPQPYNPNASSSYGYVTTNKVNFRVSPGTGASMKFLNQYAFSLILGSRVVNGTTWYNVNQNGTVGWVSGNFFHTMSLAELEGFLASPEYYQGIANNSAASGSSSSSGSTSSGTNNSSGSATTGTIGSVEDWNVGVWQNPNAGGSSATYPPFDPNATPSVTASYEPFNPSASATPSASGVAGLTTAATDTPAPTFVIGTMIPISYENESVETQTDTPWGLIVGAGVLLLGGAGGVYAYAIAQNKKRRAAAARAAAQRRNGQGGQPAQPQNPYQRRAVAAPPYAGQQRSDKDRAQQGPYRGYPPQGQNGAQGGYPQQGQNGYPPQTANRAYPRAEDGLRAAPPLSGTRQAPYDGGTPRPQGDGYAQRPANDPYAQRPATQHPAEDGYGSAARGYDGAGRNPYARPEAPSGTDGAQPYESASPRAQGDPLGANGQRRPRATRDSGAGRTPEA